MEFSSLQCAISRCRWWHTFERNKLKERHDSGSICINSRNTWDESKEPCVFPKHYNQVFFHSDVLDRDWWFILRHDTRYKHVYENNNSLIPIEEDNEGYDNQEWYLNALFHHLQIEMGFFYCYQEGSNYIFFNFHVIVFVIFIGKGLI